jgi:hypothetical protein
LNDCYLPKLEDSDLILSTLILTPISLPQPSSRAHLYEADYYGEENASQAVDREESTMPRCYLCCVTLYLENGAKELAGADRGHRVDRVFKGATFMGA